MDMTKYIEIFIEESKEHLQGLNHTLLELEKNPKEISLVNEIFRIAHTLKGMAGTMGYSKMTKLTHVMEDALHLLRTGERKIDRNLIDSLFKCLDALEGYVSSITDLGIEGIEEHQNLIAKITELMNLEEAAGIGSTRKEKNVSKEIDQSSKVQERSEAANANSTNRITTTSGAFTMIGDNGFEDISLDQYEVGIMKKGYEINTFTYRVDLRLDKGCMLKSARSFLFFQALEKHGEIIKSIPSSEDIEDEKFEFDVSVVILSTSDQESLNSDMSRLSEVEIFRVHQIDLLDITTSSSDTATEEGKGENSDVSLKDVEKEKSSTGAIGKNKHGKTVRVDIERLDVLMNLVSELIIIKTRLEGINFVEKSQNYSEAVEYLERITTNLHDAVMKVRMVPVETVFNRFPRMIRDIARGLNKEITLSLSGEETELDRTVIDEIGDPLIHLLRNSVDHGIESLENRKKVGKNPEGHIDLRAFQDGNNVVIEVEDDGAGISVSAVRKKAIERGLVSVENANSLSQKEIIDFLFMASFSTADKITDLSGRGVGLDVVKTKIESLGGVVEVLTEEGAGTKFMIRLPLTLAIIQALLVLVGEEKYAIPLSSIKEIIKVPRDEIKQVQQRDVMLLRDTIVPVIWLAKILDVPTHDVDTKMHTVVVLKKGDKLQGVVVDSLIGQHEIVIKSLGKLMKNLKIIAGATILGDGNVALIVDVNSLA